jgi:hypothetical protein
MYGDKQKESVNCRISVQIIVFIKITFFSSKNVIFFSHFYSLLIFLWDAGFVFNRSDKKMNNKSDSVTLGIDDKNMKFETSQNRNVVKKRCCWRGLLVASTAVAVICGHVENVKARFTSEICTLLKETADGLPIAAIDSLDGITSRSCNTHIANTLASAIFSPLAFIAANGVGAPVAAPVATRAAADVFVAAAPAPGGPPVLAGIAGVWGLVDPASTSAIIGAPAPAVAAADAIVAAFLNVPGAIAVPAIPVGLIAGVPNSADVLWRHAIERAHLWKIPQHLAERLAAPGGGIAAAHAVDLNYLIWSRAARVGTPPPALPIPGMEHTSFVVPGNTDFSTHFDAVLGACDMTAAIGPIPNLQVSWNNTLDGVPAIGPLIAAWGVHVHVDTGAAGGLVAAQAGTAIKADITAGTLGAQPTINGGNTGNAAVDALAAPTLPGGPHPHPIVRATRNELIATLREAAAVRAALTAGIPINTFGTLLGAPAGQRARASTPMPIRNITMYLDANAVVTSIFPR